MEDNVARGVAGAVAHVEGELADGHLVAVCEPSRRLERAAVDPVLGTFGTQLLDPEAILLMRALDRDSELFGENAGGAAMVDVAVGQQDLFDCDARLLSRRFQPWEISTRVDERCPQGI